MSVVQLITDPGFGIGRPMFDFYKHIFGKGERVLSAIKPEPIINSIAGTKTQAVEIHWVPLGAKDPNRSGLPKNECQYK